MAATFVLLAAISFALFALGFVAGSLLVIAIRINLEDRTATRRMLTSRQLDGAILLHEEPEGRVAHGVRSLLVGQRTGPGKPPGDQGRDDR